MAEFTRKELRQIFADAELEVPKDVLTQLCDLHTSASDELTEALKTARTSLEKAEHERDAYKAKAPKEGEETVSKSDYDKVVNEFGEYKAGIEKKEAAAAKDKAARSYFESKSISGKNLDIAMRGCQKEIESLELDGEKIKDAAALDALIAGDFASLVSTTTKTGAPTAKPPENNGTTKDPFEAGFDEG